MDECCLFGALTDRIARNIHDFGDSYSSYLARGIYDADLYGPEVLHYDQQICLVILRGWVSISVQANTCHHDMCLDPVQISWNRNLLQSWKLVRIPNVWWRK